MKRVLIAGGGVCGASLAIMLGRAGVEVELFERGTFPREKPCGEGMMPSGVAILERLGLASSVLGAPFYGVRYNFPHFNIEGRFPSRDGRQLEGRGQRRLMLDGALFTTATATPGVSARTNAVVNEPIVEKGRVTGLVVDGVAHQGDLVVAADGLQSPMRKALGLDLPPRRRRFGLRIHYRVKEGREQPPWVDVFPRRGYELYLTPLPDREILVAALVDRGRLDQPAEKEFMRWVHAEAEISERLEGAEQISDLAGCSPLESRARCGVTPGAVLLGDAAGFKDPITACGMAHALVTAELLSKYIVSAKTSQENWIWQFDNERSRILRDSNMVTSASLWLTQHPRLAVGAFRAMSVAPQVFSHFVSVSGGARRLLGTSPAY